MAITRINLCLAPALKVTGDPTWTTPTGWVRSTSLHATLPRQTGVSGAAAGTARSPVAPVVPGRSYVASVSMRAVAAQSGTLSLRWFAVDDTVLGDTATTPYSQGASTTARLSTGPHVAPEGAAYCRLSVTVTAASTQLTAVLVEQTTVAGGTYFDGDDPGARWAGVSGASLSVLGTGELIAQSLTYDHELGRVRVLPAHATGPGIGRVRVLRRATTSNRFAPVRGGELPTQNGEVARTADDYEFPADLDLIYRLETHAGGTELLTGSVLGAVPVAPVETLEVFYRPPLARGWLKFVANPILNRRITLIGPLPEVSRPDRNSVFEVRERTDPVIVTAGHGSRRFTLRLRTFTRDETEALDTSLKQGIPGFLHLPPSTPLPSIYCVIGAYSYVAPSARSQGAVWSVPLIEVAPPALSIFATGATYATVLEDYATYAELLAAAPDWRGVQ